MSNEEYPLDAPKGRGGPIDWLLPAIIKSLLSHVEEVGEAPVRFNLSNGKIIHHGSAFTWIPNPE